MLVRRDDIDGLRAVAVLSVVFFHVIPRKPLGGFVGVDVFFVISGYLISSIIIREMSSGRFSFADFYARRARRIFPALAVVLLSTLFAGWLVLLPDEFIMLGKHTIGAAAFAANLVFWSEASYFDVASELKPLLHLWSLGVEEQFYLVWPITLYGLFRLRIPPLLTALTLLVASLIYCVYLTSHDVTAAFYNPLSRAWELMAGSVLASLTYRPSHRTASVLSIAGTALLTYSIINVRPDDTFPGLYAAFPVAGTALIIAAGPLGPVNRTLLASRPMTWIGGISYPLYLWHWPMLSLYRIWMFEHPSLVMALIMIGISIALAWGTSQLVERPIRFSAYRLRTAVACGLVVLASAAGLASYTGRGLAVRPSDSIGFVAYFNALATEQDKYLEERSAILQDQCNFYDYERAHSGFPTRVPRSSINAACYTRKPGTRSVMLWGDSHAAAYLQGLQATLPESITPLLVFGSGCRVKLPDETLIEKDYCERTNWFSLNVAKEDRPDVVFIAPSTPVDIMAARAITGLLKSYGVKHVVIVGPLPQFVAPLYKIIARRFLPEIPQRIKGFTVQTFVDLDRSLRAAVRPDEPFTYVGISDVFCAEAGCLTYVGDDPVAGLIYFDNQHLRAAASQFAARSALTPAIVSLLGSGRSTPGTHRAGD